MELPVDTTETTNTTEAARILRGITKIGLPTTLLERSVATVDIPMRIPGEKSTYRCLHILDAEHPETLLCGVKFRGVAVEATWFDWSDVCRACVRKHGGWPDRTGNAYMHAAMELFTLNLAVENLESVLDGTGDTDPLRWSMQKGTWLRSREYREQVLRRLGADPDALGPATALFDDLRRRFDTVEPKLCPATRIAETLP
jgi:hypothetical protein